MTAATKDRLRWQCRRGMRELDVLLSGWLDRGYDAASEEQKAAFQRLLEFTDPELAAYLLRGVPSGDPRIDVVVGQIRRHVPT